MSSGINATFAKGPLRGPAVSLCPGYITYSLLTRSPLYAILLQRTVRLACLSHAASVRSEPGSNSSIFFRQSAFADAKAFNSTKGSNARLQTRMFEFDRSSGDRSTHHSTGQRKTRLMLSRIRPCLTLQGLAGPTFSQRSLFTCQRAESAIRIRHSDRLVLPRRVNR